MELVLLVLVGSIGGFPVESEHTPASWIVDILLIRCILGGKHSLEAPSIADRGTSIDPQTSPQGTRFTNLIINEDSGLFFHFMK